MFSRWQELGKSLLIGFIPGIVFPVMFFFLFSYSTTATNRDIFPPLDNPLEIIGCFGFLIFAIPGYAAFILIVSALNTLHEHGAVIPVFDSLSEGTQGAIIVILCFLINFVFWTFIVSIIRYMRNFSATTS